MSPCRGHAVGPRSLAARAFVVTLGTLSFLIALARDVSAWLTDNRVLGEAPSTTAARLALVRNARVVLGNGMELLGLAHPSEM